MCLLLDNLVTRGQFLYFSAKTPTNCLVYDQRKHKQCAYFPRSNNICDFSEPENGIPFFCVRPGNETCPKQLIFTVSILDMNKPNLVSGPFSKLGVTYQVAINGSGFTLSAATRNAEKKTEQADCTDSGSETYRDSVKKYRAGLETYADSANGYFCGEVWHSFLCNNRIKTLDAAEHCLHNKTIYFIGDSTTRQLHLELTSFFNITDKLSGNPRFRSNPRKAEDRSRNLVFYYKAHGLPIINPGPQTSHPPVVETLNNITNDNRDIIVILNIGPHFTLQHPNVFVHRIFHIKRAIEALRQRLPNVKILVKDTVRNKYINSQLPGEWLLYRFDRIIRHVLSDVTYIDAWSMTTVQPQKTIHADAEMLRHFLALMFSHVCV